MSAMQQNIEQARAMLEALKAGRKPEAVQPTAPAPKTAEVIQIQPDAPQGAPITAAAQLAEVKQTADKDRLDAAAQSMNAAIEAENREFFVSIEGGKAGVFREGIDPEMGHRVIVGMTQSEYRLMRANRTVRITDGDNTKTVCVADAWIRSPARREYPNGFALLPGQEAPEGVYNLWRGWGIEPKEGNAKPALKHLRNVICSGDDKVFRYLLGWLAHCVQRPGDPAEVAVVLRGGRGTGKSTVGRWMAQIFGGHALHILHSRHLTGNFNAHLRGTCFLFADEAFFAGDRAGADVLKGLVTEPTITIERKGVDAFTTRNRLKIMMASNSEWVVPAGTDERRYLVLDVSDVKKQDHAYFAALTAHMENGGLAALLWFLLRYDLTAFNVRHVPHTAALDQQKLLSLSPLHSWLYARLYAGHLMTHENAWNREQSRDAVVNAFAEYAGRKGARFEHTDAAFIGRSLRKVFPDLGDTQRRTGAGQRTRFWVFPTLEEARRQFEAAVLSGASTDWPAEE